MNRHFDFVVIGGGSAGYAAARTAIKFNKSVAVIDNSKELSGLCILRGCMPSKTLLYSAEVLHLAQRGALFGLNILEAIVDMKSLHERKRRIIGEFAEDRQKDLTSGRFTLFRSKGQFIDKTRFELESGEILTANKFLIATGSYISTPPIPGLKDVPFITSDDVLDLEEVPQTVIVLGGGPVACELSQFLKRAGASVVQIQRNSRLLRHDSPKASYTIEEAFKDEGIEVFTNTVIKAIEYDGETFTITFKYKGETEVIRKAKALFNALGRKPNTHSLGLEKGGVELSPTGLIIADEHQQTTNPSIYAAGDCTGPHEIVHIAVLQGEYAAKHAFGHKLPDPINYDHLVKIIFTDPQIASVGLSEIHLQEQKIDYISAEYPFKDHGKSILMEAKRGYVKILASKETRKVLGAECVGKEASELIHSMAVAVTLDASIFDLLKAHWYHPTLSEIWTYPLEEIAEQ